MFMMIIILKSILLVLCTIILLIMLLVVTSLKYKIEVNLADEISGRIGIEVLFCILKIEVSRYEQNNMFNIYLSKIAVISKEINFDKNERYRKEKNKKSKHKKFKNLFNRQLFQEIKYYCFDIIELIKPEKFEVRGTYAFDDPSITGVICAIRPFISFCDLNITPDFEGNDSDITVIIKGKVRLIVIGFRTLKFILNKRVRKIIFSKN